jgi:hypothetical protein
MSGVYQEGGGGERPGAMDIYGVVPAVRRDDVDELLCAPTIADPVSNMPCNPGLKINDKTKK